MRVGNSAKVKGDKFLHLRFNIKGGRAGEKEASFRVAGSDGFTGPGVGRVRRQRRGRVALAGASAELLASELIHEAYIG